MTYGKQTWINDDPTTPLSKARLDHMEDGIQTAAATADAAVPAATVAELIRDTVAAFLVAGANVTLTHNDAGDTLTITASGTGGGLAATGNNVNLDGDSQKFASFTVVDDGTATSGWPNRLEFFFTTGGVTRHTTYMNEYGELRATCAKPTTTGGRVFTREFATDAAHSTSVPVFDVMDDRDNRTILAGFYSDGRLELVGSIKASNLPPRITASSTAPTSPQVGEVWIDTGS